MEHHEIAVIQGANDNKDPQGGDGIKLPLRLFIYAGGDILPGGEAYLRAVEGGTMYNYAYYGKKGKMDGNLVHSYLQVLLFFENFMLGRTLYG